MGLRRRDVLGAFTGAVTAGAYPFWESRWLEVSHRVAPLRRSGVEPVRIAHLSDLHLTNEAGPWGVGLSFIDQAVGLALAQRPDVICLTGDYISHREDLDWRAYARVLRRLSDTAPVFAVLGNHDGGRWAAAHRGHSDHRLVTRLLEDSAIELLHNRSAQISIRGQKLQLVGTGDLWAGEVQAARAFQGMRPEFPTVVLHHNPDGKESLGEFSWDLMLSGHTHGGQVVVPFAGPRFAPVKDKRFVAGLVPWDGRWIQVTRGVGNLHGVRLGCRPEVSILNVQSADTESGMLRKYS